MTSRQKAWKRSQSDEKLNIYCPWIEKGQVQNGRVRRQSDQQMAKKFIDEIWHVHSFIQSFTEASIQWCCNRVTSVNPVPFIILYAYALRQADLHLSNKILSNWSYQKRSRVDRSFYFSLFLAPDSLLYRLVKAISIKKINSCLCIEWSNWKKKWSGCVCVFVWLMIRGVWHRVAILGFRPGSLPFSLLLSSALAVKDHFRPIAP